MTYSKEQWRNAIFTWIDYTSWDHSAMRLVDFLLETSAEWGSDFQAMMGETMPRLENEQDQRALRALVCDIEHSALIPWILEGNQPFPRRPPIRFSRPWHELIATGEGYLLDPPHVWPDPSWKYCVIEGDPSWELINVGEDTWTVQYPNHGRWLVQTAPEVNGIPRYRISKLPEESC